MDDNVIIKFSKEEPKKIKRKFNFIDFLVLLIIISVIALSIYTVVSWSNIKSLLSTSSVNLQYTVEFRGVDEEFINNIKNNTFLENNANCIIILLSN